MVYGCLLKYWGKWQGLQNSATLIYSCHIDKSYSFLGLGLWGFFLYRCVELILLIFHGVQELRCLAWCWLGEERTANSLPVVLKLFSGFVLHPTAPLSGLNRFGIISRKSVLCDFFFFFSPYFIFEVLSWMVMKCNETEVWHFQVFRVLTVPWIS